MYTICTYIHVTGKQIKIKEQRENENNDGYFQYACESDFNGTIKYKFQYANGQIKDGIIVQFARMSRKRLAVQLDIE